MLVGLKAWGHYAPFCGNIRIVELRLEHPEGRENPLVFGEADCDPLDPRRFKYAVVGKIGDKWGLAGMALDEAYAAHLIDNLETEQVEAPKQALYCAVRVLEVIEDEEHPSVFVCIKVGTPGYKVPDGSTEVKAECCESLVWLGKKQAMVRSINGGAVFCPDCLKLLQSANPDMTVGLTSLAD